MAIGTENTPDNGLPDTYLLRLLPANGVRDGALGGARNKAVAGLRVQRGGRFYGGLD